MGVPISDDGFVEAIEEGKIVKVSASYAKKEGLPILRKSKLAELQEGVKKSAPSYFKTKEYGRTDLGMVADNFRKPEWKEKQVLSELIENFHWAIRFTRKRKGLTRKQLAKLINEREEDLRLIENGFLPAGDFVLVNKIQNALGINLRKDKKDFNKSAYEMMKGFKGDSTHSKEELSGSDIEILGDEV